MSNPNAADSAHAQLERIRRERAELWERIQREAPGLGRFLGEVRDRFGRPEKLEVTWHDD